MRWIWRRDAEVVELNGCGICPVCREKAFKAIESHDSNRIRKMNICYALRMCACQVKW